MKILFAAGVYLCNNQGGLDREEVRPDPIVGPVKFVYYSGEETVIYL
jgi:hypothetical protein